ncbi:hypothetical protein ACP8HI_00415 [Paenibacillus sp. FA6]|uniref:hypothetical protein n=1 Tax=Paenibacillus sp. FA6 TaxID=3413029 RepID=UPI003F65B383
MQITIEDNAIMYIYLKSSERYEKVGKLISDVRCGLLYDGSDNLIGIKVFNERTNDGNGLIEQIDLPNVGIIDMPIYKSKISKSESDITILFDTDSIIHHIREDECNIDLCDEGIYGIEPIPFTYIGGKEIIKPFIIRDKPLTLTKHV